MIEIVEYFVFVFVSLFFDVGYVCEKVVDDIGVVF